LTWSDVGITTTCRVFDNRISADPSSSYGPGSDRQPRQLSQMLRTREDGVVSRAKSALATSILMTGYGGGKFPAPHSRFEPTGTVHAFMEGAAGRLEVDGPAGRRGDAGTRCESLTATARSMGAPPWLRLTRIPSMRRLEGIRGAPKRTQGHPSRRHGSLTASEVQRGVSRRGHGGALNSARLRLLGFATSSLLALLRAGAGGSGGSLP
jgi:hypothetical protein